MLGEVENAEQRGLEEGRREKEWTDRVAEDGRVFCITEDRCTPPVEHNTVF